jgi:hypothetical protein
LSGHFFGRAGYLFIIPKRIAEDVLIALGNKPRQHRFGVSAGKPIPESFYQRDLKLDPRLTVRVGWPYCKRWRKKLKRIKNKHKLTIWNIENTPKKNPTGR